MRRSAEYTQQIARVRITNMLRDAGSRTADELAFALGVSKQDIRIELGSLINDRVVKRHHISDGTLRYSLVAQETVSAVPHGHAVDIDVHVDVAVYEIGKIAAFTNVARRLRALDVVDAVLQAQLDTAREQLAQAQRESA